VLVAAGASAGALLAGGATAAQAAQLNGCTGSGRVFVPAPGHPGWNVDGAGSCPVQLTPTAPFTAREPTTVRFSGSGTSDSLGIAITHIYLKCGNSGNSPSANFAWSESP
jgi:hypothetical protein